MEHQPLVGAEPAATRERSAPTPPFWVRFLLLVAILGLAAYFRTLSLTTWDADTGQHPDERFFSDVASSLHLPGSLAELYDASRSPLNPRNYDRFSLYVYGPFPQLLTRAVAVALTPNERLPAEARGFIGPPQVGSEPTAPNEVRTSYGPAIPNPERAFPKLSFLQPIFNPDSRNLTGYGEIQKVGRGLAVLFDLGSICLIFLLGYRLFSGRVGLLAALFAALSVMPIQQSHFFVDPIFSTFFCLLSLYWAVRVAQGRGWSAYALLGVSIGAAMANRITLATLGGLAVVAAVIAAVRFAQTNRPAHAFDRFLRHELPFLVLAGTLTLLSFRTFAPDAFVGSTATSPVVTPSASFFQGLGFFDLRPEPRFLSNLSSVQGLVNGEVDFPPGQQWVGRSAYLFPWINMVLWGMGPGLGLVAWGGLIAFAALGLRRVLWPRADAAPLNAAWVPCTWAVFYFAWQGNQFAITLRYLLPIYGALTIFGAWALVQVWTWGRGQRGLRRTVGLALPLISVLLTLGWAYAFTRIYTLPHSRVMAARWFADHAPAGSSVMVELWDDPLPLQVTTATWGGTYQGVQSAPYAEDDASKYAGTFNDEGQTATGLLAQLDQADYITLTSNRIYDSTSRLRMRYPVLMRYYHYLFTGELGFTLVAEVTSYPTILGLEIPDQPAEEAFHVYDHPRVLIFAKTGTYSSARVKTLLTQDVLWSEVYKSPLLIADRNQTALRLTDGQWPRYTTGGTWSAMFNRESVVNTVAPLLWVGVLELLGLALFALGFRLLPMLPDRGYSLSKLLGLLVVAYLAWLAGSLGNDPGVPGNGNLHGIGWGPFPLPFTPTTLWLCAAPLLAVGATAAWLDRIALRAFWYERRAAIIGAETVLLSFLLLGLLVRWLNPDLWHPGRGGEKPMDFAYLNAVLKSAAFPPYDPWHAGGYINYYYFGFVLIGALIQLTTVVPSIGYNLAVATVFGLTALGAWGVVYNLLADRRTLANNRRTLVAAGLAPVLLLLLGNLAQAVWFINGYAGQQWAAGRPEWAFWDATRIVPDTVNEFPFFTFLFADLHAHMLVMPLSLALLGLALALARACKRGHWLRLTFPLLLAGLLAGAIRATNTWDYPTFVGLASLIMAGAAWRASRGRRSLAWTLVWMLVPPLLMVSLGNLLFAPFTANFATESSGIELWTSGLATTLPARMLLAQHTTVREVLQLYGHWLVVAALAGLLLLRRMGGPLETGLAAFALLLAWVVGAWLNWPAVGLLLPLLGVALWLLWRLRRAPLDLWLPALWLTAALGLCALVEVVVVKGDVGRMNTVFKFGLHTWMLFALGAAALLPRLWTMSGNLRYGVRGGLVLLGAAALVYPLTATPSRLADRWVPEAPHGLDGAAFMGSVSAERFGTTFSLNEDAAAIDWLQRNVAGTPVILEAHLPSYQWAGRIATFTGLPTLLGWEWHQVQQRNAAGAGPVIAARQQIIATIYNTPDTATALEQLRLYGVQYIYVGGVERATYKPEGLAKFEALTAAGTLERVFQQGQTAIYRVDTPGTPRMLTSDLPVVVPTLATPPPLLLDTPVNKLPVVGEYAWNSLVRDNSLLATLLWLICLYGVGLLGLPVAHAVFGKWHDGGLVWAKLLGLLLWGYAVWLPTSLGLWHYDRWGLLGGLGLVVLLNGGVLWWVGFSSRPVRWGEAEPPLAPSRPVRWGEAEPPLGTEIPSAPPDRSAPLAMLGAPLEANDEDTPVVDAALWPTIGAGLRSVGAKLRERRWAVFWTEGIFLIAFVALAYVRALNPDLWHFAWGGEKPMEFGFLNAILRSPVLPPYDPFFSGGYINYYYYGLYLISLPLKATGIAPAVGFNLGVATIFGLTLAGAVALVRAMTGRLRYGLLAALLVGVLGNLTGYFAAGWSRGLNSVVVALREGGLTDIGSRLGDWYIGPSRVIPNTINEFPAFSFLFADLHPHLIALPIALLVLAMGYGLLTAPKQTRRATLLLLALALGTLAVTNSWDFPTYGLLTGLVLLGTAWRAGGSQVRGVPWAALLRAALLAIGVNLGGLVLYTPFFDRYWAPVGGIGLVRWANGTTLTDHLLIYGLFLAIVLPVLVGSVWQVTKRRDAAEEQPPVEGVARRFLLGRGARFALVGLIAVLIAAGFVPMLGLRLVLAALLLIGLLLLPQRQVETTVWYALLLAWVAWAVTLGCELIYIRDHLDGGDWYRMNTVFKFGLQAWVLLALAAAASLPTLLRGLRHLGGPIGQGMGLIVLTLLASLTAIYPLAAVPSRIANRFPVTTGPTLDGLAFMDTTSFTYDCEAFGGCEPGVPQVTIDLSGDAAAIRWLNETVQGTPIVVQTSLFFYRAYGIRIAANTGLPTVVSGLHENEQRAADAATRRIGDVETFYTSSDPETALRFLARYGVDYVYVGGVEHAIYPATGLEKFTRMVGTYLTPVFTTPQVQIYAVRGVPTNYASPAPADFSPSTASTDVVEPADLVAFETANRTEPTNGPVAFGLAERYRNMGRLVDAARVLEPAARANPNDMGVLHLWGDILAQDQRYDEAEAAYMLAVKAEPSVNNWNKLGVALLAWSRFDKAEIALSQAIAADPQLPEPHYHLGRLFAQIGNADRARFELQSYLALDPEGRWAKEAWQLLTELGARQ